MIRRHFRVLEMGSLLPGQNLELPPPYVVAFAVTGEAAPARIEQLTRVITIYPGEGHSTRVRATWTLHPRLTRVESGGRTLANGADEIDLAGASTLKLTASDGATNTWHLKTQR
jgi:hypothetical protein